MSKKNTRHLHIELTPEQYQMLNAQAKQCGLTKRAYIVRLLEGSPVRSRPTSEIKALRTEIHHIGNDVNQIARSVNIGIARAEDAKRGLVRLGADMCISGKRSYPMIAELAYAQLRRYTEYNFYNDPASVETAPFQIGDIYIDPARQTAEVCGRPVNLRHREFSLLLYFMRNPKIVLTPEQICEHAWRMEYTQPVDRAIHELRKQIEPDPAYPWYVKTVYRVGYCFTAYRSEIEKAAAL